MNYLVVTGDVINFTSLNVGEREDLIVQTDRLIKSWVKKPAYAAIFRGDSFQLLFDEVSETLKRSIQLRCWFKKFGGHEQSALLDAKLSIGMGEISYMGKSVLDADGEAFHLSGRSLDAIRDSNTFRITTPDEAKNRQIAIIINLINILITEWTAKQAEVLFLLLEGKKQQEIADELQVVQSAVSNRIKLSRWNEIEQAISYIASLMQE